jgi:hypothetical protein
MRALLSRRSAGEGFVGPGVGVEGGLDIFARLGGKEECESRRRGEEELEKAKEGRFSVWKRRSEVQPLNRLGEVCRRGRRGEEELEKQRRIGSVCGRGGALVYT